VALDREFSHYHDATAALLAGEWSSGYKFVIAGCQPTEKGIVIRYQITAVRLLVARPERRPFALMNPALFL
jgi:hypothetical protein